MLNSIVIISCKSLIFQLILWGGAVSVQSDALFGGFESTATWMLPKETEILKGHRKICFATIFVSVWVSHGFQVPRPQASSVGHSIIPPTYSLSSLAQPTTSHFHITASDTHQPAVPSSLKTAQSSVFVTTRMAQVYSETSLVSEHGWLFEF